jgi:RNA polymerase sigma-70 factor, ECF subfamily
MYSRYIDVTNAISESKVAMIETFESYRPLLFSIAYRMLGSVMEAEDMVQETYLRYVAVSPENIRNLKSFLTTIVTRLCLDHLKSAKAQRETYIGPWLPEPLLTDKAPLVGDVESISMAFLVLLESLTPVERAVFLLREVFEYDYSEIASILSKEEAACRQSFHRAKQHIAAHRPRFKTSPDEQHRVLSKFLQACAEGEVQSFVSLLAQDVTWWSDGGGKTRAAIRPVHGREAVARLLAGLIKQIPQNLSMEIAEVNGGVGLILRIDGASYATLTFDTDGEHICAIRFILNPDKLQRIV